MTPERIRTDVLILGAGGAGLFAALHAKRADPTLDVTIAVKGLLGKCGCTRMVQGGYNVALAEGDSVERHFMDTIEGGKWLPDQDLAWTLVTGAIERIRELENEIGCFFDRNPDGIAPRKAFAGQTFDRTVHKGDLTGIEIVNRLIEQVWARPGIRRLEEHRAVAFVRARTARWRACCFVDVRTGAFVSSGEGGPARDGGGPTMYKFHTPSGDKSWTGSRWRCVSVFRCATWRWCSSTRPACWRAPDTRMTGTIIEEGLARGRRLPARRRQRTLHVRLSIRAASGRRAIIVSRSMFAEMQAGRTTPNGGVYIAMGHLGAEKVRKQFKGMVERCADCGFDLAGGLVEVVPTAHYLMGGVDVRARYVDGRAGAVCRRRGLRAACMARTGSAATASRIRRCSAASRETRSRAGWRSDGAWREPVPADLAAAGRARRSAAARPRRLETACGIEELRERALHDDVGRHGRRAAMQQALARAEEAAGVADQLGRIALAGDARARHFNLTWHDVLNLANLTAVSQVIVHSAQARENSRGAHFRADFAAPGDLPTSTYTQARAAPDGTVAVAARPVRFTRGRPGDR